MPDPAVSRLLDAIRTALRAGDFKAAGDLLLDLFEADQGEAERVARLLAAALAEAAGPGSEGADTPA